QLVPDPVGGCLGDPGREAHLGALCRLARRGPESRVQGDREAVDVHAYDRIAYRRMRQGWVTKPSSASASVVVARALDHDKVVRVDSNAGDGGDLLVRREIEDEDGTGRC